MNKYLDLFKIYLSSEITLDKHFSKIFRNLIKKNKREILINFEKYFNLSKDIKMAIINESIKRLKKNYYDLRSKKVDNLIKNIEKVILKIYSWRVYIF